MAKKRYPIKTEGTAFVTLRNFECYLASMVGVTRNITSMFKKQRHWPPLGNKTWAWINHVEGAGAECSVGKHTDHFWDGSFGTFTDKPDVGPYHVKWIRKRWVDGEERDDGRLRVPLRKPPNELDIFILVRGAMPHYELVGWIRAGEVMKPENIDNPNNRGEEYFITQDRLYDMEKLPDG